MDQSKKKFKFSYHWVIFGIGFLMVFTALGFNSSVQSYYKNPIIQQVLGEENFMLYAPRMTVRYIATAVLNIYFGALVAKFGARKLIGAGFVSLILYCVLSALCDGSLICSVVKSVFGLNMNWSVTATCAFLYAASIFFGIGLAWTTTTIVGILVEKWFTNDKGKVMGIILAANGFGGAVAEFLLSGILYNFSKVQDPMKAMWQRGYYITALILFVVGVVSVLLIRNTPEDMKLDALGKNSVAKKKRGSNWVGFEMDDIKRKKYFYITGACVFITGFVLNSFNGNARPHMEEMQIANLAFIMSAHSIALTFSKILAGFAFDKFGIRFTFGYCSLAAVISLLALCGVSMSPTVAPWLYSILSSVALPLETIMIPLLVAEMFGRKNYSKIMGYYLGLNTFGYAAGSLVVDFFRDQLGSYTMIFTIFAVILTLNLVVVQFAFVAAKKDRENYEKRLSQDPLSDGGENNDLEEFNRKIREAVKNK
ncbi:MAG: MFS transporter [Ruminococcaceae bacterium]|nr:MFS transporter [Oscillospiraceae bacterium]